MKSKQFAAGLLAAALLLGGFPAQQEALAAEGTSAQDLFNKEGVWLTEIYQNDVDRSEKNNTRESKGYERIHLYDTTSDLMEFLEITSTHEGPISLNDLYEFYYGDEKLNVTGMDGNTNITIQKGQSVVLWNCRSGLDGRFPTEEEFREDMRIPDDTLILKITNNKNWAVTSTFSVKRKADQQTVSTFKATTDVHTKDGYSVELEIPDIGAQMQVYREMNLPSAGYVYTGQLNGLVDPKIPADSNAKGVYLTEIRPNDTDRSASYGLTDDFMECFEIVNTTDQAVDLNKEYQIDYVVKEGSRKPLTLYHYADSAPEDLSSEGCTIPAGGTAVIWCFRKDYHLTGYTSFPTEADFRAAYGIPDEVPVYLFTNQNGMNNTTRGVEIYKLQDDGSKDLISSYAYVGSADCKNNKSAELAVNPEGPEMLLQTANATTSMGTVTDSQITYLQDDGSRITLRPNDTVPEFITQGEELRVNFYFNVTGALPRTGITTYYRFDGTGDWHSTTEAKRRVPNLYEVLIPADEIFSHQYVEFYVSADNRYHSTLSDIYTVQIRSLNETDGIRTNISEGEEVSGVVSVTANNGGDNTASKIYIDGKEYTTVPMLEDGGYFTFHADGRDSYFKTAVTTVENEMIAAIGKWQYTILDGQAIHIDNSYFTFNEANNTYDVTLRFWAGTYGTTVNEYLEPEANREDFTVTQLALRLINGKEYLPTKIGPDDPETKDKTNLSTAYDAVHSVGDSAGWCPYMDVSFSVPASEVTAVGAQVDTTKLSEGKHTLTVTDGTNTTEVAFVVDNTAPEIAMGIEDGSVLTKDITLDPKVTEANTLEKFSVTLDGEEIETPYATTAYKLGKGEHTLTAFAEDAAGNQTTKTVTFQINDISLSLGDAGTTDITDSSAKLYLSLQSPEETEATFYKAEKIDTAKIETNTEDGILPYIQYTMEVGDAGKDDVIVAKWDGSASNSDDTHASTMFVKNTETGAWDKIASADSEGSIQSASFKAENHVKDGKATIIVQCTADSALPDLETETDGKMDVNAGWTGDTVPEDYDFCFAWETDTQYYAEEWQNHFLNMNQWIVDYADAMKIKYVIHTGDIVDDCDMLYQWENADEAMGILDEAGMPYGVLGGNHDVAAGLENFENYYTYFGEDRFASQPTYGGSYKNNRGHYDLISENGQDFIILYMSWNIYQEEIDWMNQVLQQYSDRKAILCFHTYSRVTYSNGSLMDYFGTLIQNEVVAKNPNVFAVLNGHYHGASYQTTMFDDNGDGEKERTVYQICTDYQSGFEGGNEYIKFLYFDLDNNKIFMNSYSPHLKDFNYYDEKDVANLNVDGASDIEIDKMVLDVDFNTDGQTILENSFSAYLCKDEKIGTAAWDSESGEAALTLNGLKPETEYAWYAVAGDEEIGYVKTDVYEFTTKDTVMEIPDSNNPGNGAGNGNTDGSAEVPQTGGRNMLLPVALLGMTASAFSGWILLRKRRSGISIKK